MKVTYIEDLHVPELGEWKGDSTGDPLHPAFGPLPDLVGLLECCGEQFMSAIWDTPRAILATVEMLREDSEDPDIPLLKIDEAYKMRGWIVQSYRWAVTENGLICAGRTIMPPEGDGEQWQKMMYRTIMMESLKLAATIPVGLG